MRIKVTQAHIEQGDIGDPSFCPIALAVKESLPEEPVDVDVSALGRISISYPYYISCKPRSTTRFVKLFDSGEDVEPFAFNLPITKKHA